ncbi:hypothetical protein CPB97_004251, partial [Podila verticillata]
NTTTNDATGGSLSSFRPRPASSASVAPSTTAQPPVSDCPAQGSLSINSASTPASKGIPTSTFFNEYTEACSSPTPKRRRYDREADIEEQEEASMIEMPRSPAVRRQQPNATARTMRTPTSTHKVPSTFASHEPSAVRLVSQFYSSHAPQELIKIWRQKLQRRPKWDASFVESAIDVVVDRTRRDLRRSSKGVIGQVDPPLKRPAYQGVLDKDKRKNKGKGKRLNEDEDRNGNKDDNEYKHKDDGEDVAEDEESEVGEDVEEEEDVEKKEDAKEEEDVEMMDFIDMVESQKVVWMAQAVEADSDAEEEDAVKVEDKVKGKNDAPTRRKPHRNPVSVRGCIAAMLLFMTSQKCNAFQTVMGVFLHCTGCPTRVLDVLSSLGLSVSDDQVRKALANMTKDAKDQVKKAVLHNEWFVVYDNINIAMKHHHQRINKLDTFDNGTAATVILIHAKEDYEKAEHDEKAEHGETSEHDERGPDDENGLDDEISLDDESDTDDESNTDDESSADDEGRDNEHDEVNKSDKSPACVVPIVEVDPLPIQKSITFQLQTMKIDESTIAGNLSVLETITDVGLGLARTWFAKLPNIIVAGDQMTVARLLSLQIHQAIDPNPFGSLSWVHPVPQLFHMWMTLCGTIFRTHYGEDNTCGSLSSLIVLLRRKHLTKDSLNFKTADELLRLVFKALLLML